MVLDTLIPGDWPSFRGAHSKSGGKDPHLQASGKGMGDTCTQRKKQISQTLDENDYFFLDGSFNEILIFIPPSKVIFICEVTTSYLDTILNLGRK